MTETKRIPIYFNTDTLGHIATMQKGGLSLSGAVNLNAQLVTLVTQANAPPLSSDDLTECCDLVRDLVTFSDPASADEGSLSRTLDRARVDIVAKVEAELPHLAPVFEEMSDLQIFSFLVETLKPQ